MVTTARASTRAGLVICAQAFQAANPTLCRAVFDVRPTRFSGDLPLCFAEILTEDGLHTSGTQQRVLEPSFVFVLRPIENSEQVTIADAIVDGFTEHLKDFAHISENIVWSRLRTTEESFELPTGEVYPALRFTLLDATEMTGRTA